VPSKIEDPELVEELLHGLSMGAFVCNACARVGVHPSVFYDWMRKGEAGNPKYAEFAARASRAMADAEYQEVVHIKDATRTDPNQARWFLSHRYRERWADSSQSVVTGPDGGPMQIEVNVLEGWTPDQLEELHATIAEEIVRRSAAVAAGDVPAGTDEG
jgi:transposase-like protein